MYWKLVAAQAILLIYYIIMIIIGGMYEDDNVEALWMLFCQAGIFVMVILIIVGVFNGQLFSIWR